MSLEGRLMFVAAFLCLIAGAGGKREEEAQPHKQPAKAKFLPKLVFSHIICLLMPNLEIASPSSPI